MTVHLKKPSAGAVPIHAVDAAGFAKAVAALALPQQRWLQALGFSG
ncbi:MAG: hypothetical protein IT501_06850, partial [Rubrivivax sp.]|nr:hypothetical protein [Rubrivivax sp.]